jgi:hypothetical protein
MRRGRTNFICTAEACDEPAFAKKLCSKHYQRSRYKPHPRQPRKTTCTHEGCGRKAICKQLCLKHYQRTRYIPHPRLARQCSIIDCGKPARARGLCQIHYKNVRYHERHPNATYRKNHTLPPNCFCGAAAEMDMYCAPHYNQIQHRIRRHQWAKLFGVQTVQG